MENTNTQVRPENSTLLPKQATTFDVLVTSKEGLTCPKGEAGVTKLVGEIPYPTLWSGCPPTGVFIVTPSLGDCHPRLKSLSPAHETNYPPPEVNLVFLGDIINHAMVR